MNDPVHGVYRYHGKLFLIMSRGTQTTQSSSQLVYIVSARPIPATLGIPYPEGQNPNRSNIFSANLECALCSFQTAVPLAEYRFIAKAEKDDDDGDDGGDDDDDEKAVLEEEDLETSGSA